MLQGIIEDLQTWVDGLPMVLQVVALLAIALTPFLEGDVAVVIRLVSGVPWMIAVVVSAAGTIVVTLAAVALGAGIGGKRTKGERERKILARVEKWGIPIAMLMGGLFISVPLNAFVMSTAGLNRSIVLISGIATAIFNIAFVALLTTGILGLVL